MAVSLYGRSAFPGRGTSIEWSVENVTAPPDEFPVTLPMAKGNARQDPAPGPLDALWKLWIHAAVGFLEVESRRMIAPRTVSVTYHGFPHASDELVIPVAPVRAVNSITYKDETGTDAAMEPAAYGSWLAADPPYLWPTEAWPSRYAKSLVYVEADVGYLDAALVPPQLRHAVLVLTSTFEAHPEMVDKNGDVKSLRAVRSLAMSAGLGGYP